MTSSRRLCAAAAIVALAGALAAPPARADQGWHDIDMAGVSPDLHFAMTRASDGKLVHATDFRGDVVLLYFGYTSCPDVCPLTMGRIAQLLGKLGKQADRVRPDPRYAADPRPICRRFRASSSRSARHAGCAGLAYAPLPDRLFSRSRHQDQARGSHP
jgi:hypothetical protein